MTENTPIKARSRTLVTCHANADFDALGCMAAAAILHGDCDLLFPGTQEKNLNSFLEELSHGKPPYLGLSFIDPAKADWNSYGTLIVCDTRQRGRLRHVWPLLESPDVRVEAWDHHPDTNDDIRPDTCHMARTGAATSLLVGALREQHRTLTPDEATLLGMGIYSDTGSFSFSSTTSGDFEAASWLLSHGMDINTINEHAALEMTSVHIHALNSLLESAQSYPINGTEVVLAETSLDNYLGDFAYLAHRMMEMEKFSVLFAIGRMDDRVQVVARSRSNAVNVGAICSELGGGGHVYAASASIRDKTLNQVHDAILNALYLQQHGDKTARDYMSSPAVGLEEGKTISEADELITHFGLKSVPVFRKGSRRCVGLLDITTTQKAMAHGLSKAKVDDYMFRRIVTLPPEADLKDITTVIVGSRQRLVPIVVDDMTVGVITRTDLINIFAQEPGRMETNRQAKSRNFAKTLEERLPPSILAILRAAAELGIERRTPVYVVGGFVRDLLLKTPNHDIDLVVEGDGLGFAMAFAEKMHGRVRVHKKFLTSVVLFPGKDGETARVDVATARLEYYESPAALPTVEHSSIKMDLYRRDFTINALAIRLDSTPMGQLVDFFGGQRDIKEQNVRILHTLSFVEDPTRCMRAVRFEQRYNFHIGPTTEKLIHNVVALKLLDKLSPQRIFNEFEHIANEERAFPAIVRLNELGILAAINPQLALNPTKQAMLPKVARVLAWYRLLYLDEPVRAWLVYFLALVRQLSYNDALSCFTSLGLPAAMKNYCMGGRERMRGARPYLKRLLRNPDWKISAFSESVRLLPTEMLLYLMAESEEPEMRRALSRYITQWKNVTIDITGNDLKALGLQPGPRYAKYLRRVLLAKLDEEAVTPEAELELVRRLMAEDDGVENTDRGEKD